MDFNNNNQFETELRAYKPRAPGAELASRIEERIHQAEQRQRYSRWRARLAWGGFAVAASILVVFGLSLFRTGPISPVDDTARIASNPTPAKVTSADLDSPSFKPVLAQNNLQERVDEGIVFLKNGMTARKYRYEFIDRVVWRNPADGSVIEMEVPRDEVVLIPVQTF